MVGEQSAFIQVPTDWCVVCAGGPWEQLVCSGEQNGGPVHRHRPILDIAISVQSVLDVSGTTGTHQIDFRMMLRGVWSIHRARENTKGLHFALTLSSSL